MKKVLLLGVLVTPFVAQGVPLPEAIKGIRCSFSVGHGLEKTWLGSIIDFVKRADGAGYFKVREASSAHEIAYAGSMGFASKYFNIGEDIDICALARAAGVGRGLALKCDIYSRDHRNIGGSHVCPEGTTEAQARLIEQYTAAVRPEPAPAPAAEDPVRELAAARAQIALMQRQLADSDAAVARLTAELEAARAPAR